jgi:uncharacterized protein YndB with AHSA1/START domain
MKTATISRKTVPANHKTLEITRIFNAPRERLWRAWVDPEQVKQWWGPKIFTAPYCSIDFQVNGKYLMCMRSDIGPDIWNKGIWSTGVYKEIKPLQRIIYSDHFADEMGNVVPGSYYGMEGFPDEMTVTVTFDEVRSERTKMTLVHEGLPSGMVDDCRIGWGESFDKLEHIVRGRKTR